MKYLTGASYLKWEGQAVFKCIDEGLATASSPLLAKLQLQKVRITSMQTDSHYYPFLLRHYRAADTTFGGYQAPKTLAIRPNSHISSPSTALQVQPYPESPAGGRISHISYVDKTISVKGVSDCLAILPNTRGVRKTEHSYAKH